MTIVASFSVEGYPVMFSDLLISGEENKDRSLNLPTIGNIDSIFPVGSGFVPTGLKQKIYVVNKYLAIAWADHLLAARHVVDVFTKDANPEKKYTHDDLSRIFESLDEWCKQNINIVGISYDGVGVFNFGYNCFGFTSTEFGEVRLAGSGTNDFKDIIDDFELTPPPGRNQLEAAVSTALLFSSYLSGQEVVHGNNLLKYYGGGYEVLSLRLGSLEKVSDLTYLVWGLSEQSDHTYRITLPKKIIKQSYVNGFLLIRSINLKEIEGEHALLVEGDSLHVIEPVNKRFTNDDMRQLMMPDFNSSFTCNCVFSEDANNKLNDILNIVQYTSIDNQPIRLQKDDGKYVIMLNDNFLKMVLSEVQSRTDDIVISN